jgi:branched-chain amino acid transport system permease protein
MSAGTPTPEPTPNAQGTPLRIGIDDWVAESGRRRRRHAGFWGVVTAVWESIPVPVRYGAALLLLLLVPPITAAQPILDTFGISDNTFVLRIMARFLTFALLALGLNVVVGFAGLLDLGYIAFFGIAGYLYAYLSSDFVQAAGPNGIHLPSLVSIPLIIAFVAMVGWGLGFVSLRLVGDYLAIVTLAFGQVFVQLALTATRVQFFWRDRPVDLTRGPNGISNLDDIAIFGFRFETATQYYYLFVVLLVLVYLVVHRLNQSRIGRGWRAMREDELAAEVMGIPTRGLKLLAFSTGAGIAALAGAVDAAWQGNVVPDPRYNILALINLYAMVVLGGIGSLPGAVIGALIFTVLPEILRNVQAASVLFYAGLVIGVYALTRSPRNFVAILGGTVLVALLLKLVVTTILPEFPAIAGADNPAAINMWIRRALLIPANFRVAGNVATLLAAPIILWMLYARASLRPVLMGLALYVLAFSWETRLSAEPSATRILIVGITLVALMIARPQGLLGKPEVRVV